MAAITNPTILLLVDGREDEQTVLNAIEALSKNKLISGAQIIVISEGGSTSYYPKIAKLYPQAFIQEVSDTVDLSQLLKYLQTDVIGYVPSGSVPGTALPEISEVPFLGAWTLDATLPEETAKEIPVKAVAWIASASIVKPILPHLTKLDNWTILATAKILEKCGIFFRWSAGKAGSESKIPLRARESPALITVKSRVLAVVPHYRCQPWLHRCLSSLTSQTRQPDAIAVVDDGSERPPVSIVEQFPNVTLLQSPLNVGPYRLIQQIIEDTNYDAYMFQDADDWSTSDRLEKLLYTAEATGAELIGTQELRVFEEEQLLIPACYPLDVNAALAEKPGHALLHPTSLVARDLVLRLGGFATKLRFGGDTEFLLRAALLARIVNIPDYCYFRRKRGGSLTTAPDTGLDSPARAELLKTLKSRALANTAAMRAGIAPCLSPLAKELPIELSYITGGRIYERGWQ